MISLPAYLGEWTTTTKDLGGTGIRERRGREACWQTVLLVWSACVRKEVFLCVRILGHAIDLPGRKSFICWGLNGPLLPQNPLERVGGVAFEGVSR